MNAHGKGTKNRFRARAGAVALAVAAALGGALSAQAGQGIQIRGGIKGTLNMNYRCQGPDPAIVSFKVGRIQRIDRYNARVELVAEIRNLGTEDLRAPPNKIGATITHNSVYGGPHVLGSIELRDLPKGPGAVRTVRGWATIRLTQEFPGQFAAYISVDPDWQLRYDCNPDNSLRRLDERAVMSQVDEVLGRTPRGIAYETIQRAQRRRAQELLSPGLPKPVFGR